MLTDEQPVDIFAMAKILGFHVDTVRTMARTKAIPGHKPTGKLRGTWRFYPSEVREHLDQQRQPGWNQSPQSRGRKRVA